MRRATRSCGSRPVCIATHWRGGRSAGWWRAGPPPTSGGPAPCRGRRRPAFRPRRVGARAGGGRVLQRRVASRRRDGAVAAGRCGRARRARGPARSLVAVRAGDPRLHGRVGVAPAPGTPVTALEYTTPIQFLKGVGPKRATALQRLGVRTVGDLLYHVPHRYLDATTVTPLARARVGEDVTCVGRVESTGVLPTRRGLRVFHAVLKDDSGRLECAWPGQPFLERQIKVGQLLLVTGPVRYYHGRQLAPREFIVLAGEGEDAPERGLVLPIYPATEAATHRQIAPPLHQHLTELLGVVADPHPPPLRAALQLPPLREALALVHQPGSPEDAERGRRRLAFDELFDQQLVHARAPHLAKRARRGIRFEPKRALTPH